MHSFQPETYTVHLFYSAIISLSWISLLSNDAIVIIRAKIVKIQRVVGIQLVRPTQQCDNNGKTVQKFIKAPLL